MQRRDFFQLASVGAVQLAAPPETDIPGYRIVTPHRALSGQGMPGPFPGLVVRARSPKCVDEKANRVNAAVVRDMMTKSMAAESVGFVAS